MDNEYDSGMMDEDYDYGMEMVENADFAQDDDFHNMYPNSDGFIYNDPEPIEEIDNVDGEFIDGYLYLIDKGY
jgi:hypothetical protein